jgi:hypothetical protein
MLNLHLTSTSIMYFESITRIHASTLRNTTTPTVAPIALALGRGSWMDMSFRMLADNWDLSSVNSMTRWSTFSSSCVFVRIVYSAEQFTHGHACGVVVGTEMTYTIQQQTTFYKLSADASSQLKHCSTRQQTHIK